MQLDGDSSSAGASPFAESIANEGPMNVDVRMQIGYSMPKATRGVRRSGSRVAVAVADLDFVVSAPVFLDTRKQTVALPFVQVKPDSVPLTNCSAPTQLPNGRSSGVRNRWRALGSWSRALQSLPDRTRWNVALYIVVPVLRRPAPVHPCGVGTFRSPSRTVCGHRTWLHKRSTCQGIWSRPRVIFTISRFRAAT